VSIDASPPAQPPQLSPDGNWVWDGSQWQPVTGVEPTHEGVFAAYAHKVEAADQAIGIAEPPAVVAVAVDDPYPAPAVDYSYPAAESEVPLWQQQKSSGKSVYLYVGGAVVLFLMVLIVLNSINLVSLPFFGASSNAPQGAKPSPSAYPIRSEFGKANDFLKGSLAPAMAAFQETVPGLQACTGTLSNSCFDAITASDNQMKSVLSVIDHGTIPLCLAAPMKKYRSDLAAMEAGLQLGLKGYKDNQVGEVTNGVNQFVRVGGALQGDVTAVDNAMKTQCSPDREGP
jgi:hypothetical protein